MSSRIDCDSQIKKMDLCVAVLYTEFDVGVGGSKIASEASTQLKQVKTDWRSNLISNSLSDLLMVQFNSPEIINLDPSTAIDLWHTDTICSMRPEFIAGDKEENLFGRKLSEEY
ncbi:hypothetical protein F2P81_021760 [Scophthalmus maximus]|uniref:Uncharacterized protein n=1 Tax=Scophthalmus maximus TaxID=52904 RepID=A0A6A4RX28_SCOMX|nr:hypothetical protein F2P81_021760 [Scophthalmus maximus]